MLPYIAPSLRAHILNILLSHASDNDSIPVESDSEEDPYTLRSTVTKGGSTAVGAFATCDIERGEPIVTERAICIWPQELKREEAEALFEQMSDHARDALLALANVAPSDLGEVLGRRATNGFNVEVPELEMEWAGVYKDEKGEGKGEIRPSHAGFIFPRIARMNHSCLNNADHAIDWSNLLMTVYATTPLAEGQEITIEYTSALIQRTRAERQAILQDSFMFSCACECCSLTGEALAASDRRRKEVNEIVVGIASGGFERPTVLKGFARMAQLIEEEGYMGMPEFSDPGVTGAYHMWVQMVKRRMASEED
ncbi:hypothetical protein CALVIDRAFT_534723 [Calocera viscosa TUFC12733]|uniref:SET domain-containing protein n=1 Tax=Calocera viscosa (strain TUFC12733) TaxID=1330018 RepID=A0A167PW76_CALVF|nr:hypothetical protein CALVIDRAFT_534723 [Calocera viscosa TUFC12733]